MKVHNYIIIEEYDPRITLDYYYSFKDGDYHYEKTSMGRLSELDNKVKDSLIILNEMLDPVVFSIKETWK